MNTERLNSDLVSHNIIDRVIHLDKVDSTNAFAKKNRSEGSTLIVTSEQTGGKGRFNRKWISTPGKDLTFTMVVSLRTGIDELHLVTFYSSYTLYSVIKQLLPEGLRETITLKWPNDILLNSKKIAGFLLEVEDIKNDRKKFIIGTGINVNQDIMPEEVRHKATSIYIETGIENDPHELLSAYVRDFHGNIEMIKDPDELMSRWSENCDQPGKKINFKRVEDEEERSAEVLGIEKDGALKIRFDDGVIKKFYSGEISIGTL